MLRTSINMNFVVYVRIILAAARLGISSRDVVILILRRVVQDIDQFQGGFTLVKYQPRDPMKRWKCFPIRFRKNENEFVKDLRKLSRFSLSYLVAIAAKRYLDEVLRKPENRYNYAEFPDYAIGQRTENGIICWELYWGDPGDTPERFGSTRIYRRTPSL